MKQTGEILELAVALIDGYKAAQADGKINISDITHLIKPAMKIPPAFEGLKDVPAEWVNMTEADVQEVLSYVKQVVNDPEYVTLVYHLIGAGASVVKIAKR